MCSTFWYFCLSYLHYVLLYLIKIMLLTTCFWVVTHCGSTNKESACSAGDLDSVPGLGRSPGEGNNYQLQDSGLENSMDCIVRGAAKRQTRLIDIIWKTLCWVPRTVWVCNCSTVHILIWRGEEIRPRCPRSEFFKEWMWCQQQNVYLQITKWGRTVNFTKETLLCFVLMVVCGVRKIDKVLPYFRSHWKTWLHGQRNVNMVFQ